MRCIGVFGGTFDPIHYGHLRTALEVRQRLELSHVRFVPCCEPPGGKSPLMDPAMRLHMVQAAIESEEGFVADAREIERGGVSYTVDTLASLRIDYPTTPIALMMGMDAFLSLTAWHKWAQFLDLAHIVVAHRPGWQAPDSGVLGNLIASRSVTDKHKVHTELAGCIHVAPVTQLEISSSDLRDSISAGVDPKYLVTPSVREIILKMECYAKENATEV